MAVFGDPHVFGELRGDPPMVSGLPEDEDRAVSWYLSRLRKYAPERPLAGPVEAEVLWKFRAPGDIALPESGWTYRIAPPDLADSARAFRKALRAAGILGERADIVCMVLEKVWVARNEGVFFTIMTPEAQAGMVSEPLP